MMNFSDFEEKLPQNYNDCFYVWGTGSTAQLYQESIEREHINILGYIDNNPIKWGKIFNKKMIFSPAEYMNKRDAPVLICTGSEKIFNEISKQITSFQGDFFCFDAIVFARHINELREVYDNLENEKSKDTFLKVLCHRLTCEQIPDSYVSPDQYYAIKDFCTRKDDDIFIDCGAYVGDSVEKYIWKMEGVFKRIYAFEPDINNFKGLQNRIMRLKSEWNIADNRIAIYPYGIGYKDSKAYMKHYINNYGMSSKVSIDASDDTDIIQIISLDSFFKNIQERITFIKADIESFEYKMIQGARNTIIKHKPRMAICIYHNPSDMYSIPLLIKKYNPNYHFEIRQHSYNVDETILYAYM